eukprot:TRINITY_DN3887_c0_g1_i1.p1 TRINITY_DN3887_c0_g1~~TRINITY_DN3887_c0_g1_i1.p1  ORF type:complete len:832 (-),score=163.75 TRINITY_DN3887_c0_g1_i1:339-2834(-)
MAVWRTLWMYYVQTKSLMLKNLYQMVRSWKATLVLFLAPLFFCLLCYVVQVLYVRIQTFETPNPPVYSGNVIPKCRSWAGQSCFTLLYAPIGVNWVENIVYGIANSSTLQMGTDILGLPNRAAINAYVLANQNRTQSAVIFSADFVNNNTVPQNVTYTMMLNVSSSEYDVGVHVQRAIDNAVMTVYAQQNPGIPTPSISMSYGEFPRARRRRVGGGDIVAATGSLWYYGAMMIPFIQIMQSLVYDKEYKLRAAMYITGMTRFAYWTGTLLTWMLTYVLQIFVLFGIGAAFGFQSFLNVNFGVNVAIFFSYAFSMIPLVMFLHVFCSRVQSANTVSFIFFIIGFLLQAFLASFGIQLLFDPNNTQIPKQVFQFYAPFNFAKGCYDASVKAFPVFDESQGSFVAGPGFTWADMYTAQTYTAASPFVAPPAIEAISWMWIDFIVFLALALYFDNVLPDQGGVRKPCYFFIFPKYWGINCGKPVPMQITPPEPGPDADLNAEADLAVKEDPTVPVRMLGLSKTYKAMPCASKGDVKALDKLYLTVAENSVLCLLGHNGAGKTTSINIMTGGMDATAGDALVYGHRVSTDMDQIRSIMGVCPQYDILWEELTSIEHLRVFAGIRGMTWAEACAAADRALAAVFLTSAANQPAGTYSGGMKRRLSVAVACIGDPKIIYMDEPTTGLDPVSRNEVWDVVQKVKTGKVIILTTHNMEEADVLADRVAVLSAGRLKCVGNPLHLKQKFGRGYRITVVVDEAEVEHMLTTVHQYAPSAAIESSTAGSVTLSVPLHHADELPVLFNALERGLIPVRDWGLSHTTLEDVFLAVTHNDPATKVE